ncbi:MAG: hypothetical protein H6620_10575 [Halobacteriovoraceae bacterium]|nr:hypothetical protein [Halobacteriovoraceae bacterium]
MNFFKTIFFILGINLYLLCSFSVLARECSDPEIAMLAPHLKWQHVFRLIIKSKHADVDGLICAGVSPFQSKIELISFADKNKISSIPLQELREGRILYEKSDLPEGIQALMKDQPFFGVKIGKENFVSSLNANFFSIELRFLRNLAKFSRPDFRRILVDVKHDLNQNKISTFYDNELESHLLQMNQIYLSLKVAKIDQILFKYDQEELMQFCAQCVEEVENIPWDRN